MTTPVFPGTGVRQGDDRRDIVAAIQARLDQLGVGPLATDGAFGPATRAAVLRLQAARGLTADGVVGALTWNALFALPSAPPDRANALVTELLRVAAAEVGARETGGPNRGPRVDEYLRTVGLDPARGSYAWCAAFVYYCFTRASTSAARTNPCVRTAGCMDHWRRAPAWARIPTPTPQEAATVIRAGAVFIVDHGEGKGHTGLVERVIGGTVHTIEGNTNAGGSREGDGVYRRTRSVSGISAGFIDYFLPAETSTRPTSTGISVQ